MVAPSLIIFDLDDTLVDASDVYWRARSAFVELISSETSLTKEAIIASFEKIDASLISKLGFAPGRYQEAMLQTYTALISEVPSPSKKEAITSCSSIIQTNFPKPLPGAAELLEWASSRFRTALVTRGEKEFQLKKLRHVGFERFFNTILVVPRKDSRIFSSIVENEKSAPESTWVIGDSVGADINPGLELGARCIRYVYKHSSYHWDPDFGVEPIGPFFQITDLNEAIEILKRPSNFKPVSRIGA